MHTLCMHTNTPSPTHIQIGVSGAHSVASVLESNRVLEHLILNDCYLGDDGVEPIANGKQFVVEAILHFGSPNTNFSVCDL